MRRVPTPTGPSRGHDPARDRPDPAPGRTAGLPRAREQGVLPGLRARRPARRTVVRDRPQPVQFALAGELRCLPEEEGIPSMTELEQRAWITIAGFPPVEREAEWGAFISALERAGRDYGPVLSWTQR